MDADSNAIISATGHMYGIWGQGALAMPGSGPAFLPTITEDAPGVVAAGHAYMMVSVFPLYEDTAGSATTNITLTTQGVPWYADFEALPFTWPGVPSEPNTDLTTGAVALGSTLLAGILLTL